jgi:hypothetical protein
MFGKLKICDFSVLVALMTNKSQLKVVVPSACGPSPQVSRLSVLRISGAMNVANIILDLVRLINLKIYPRKLVALAKWRDRPPLNTMD